MRIPHFQYFLLQLAAIGQLVQAIQPDATRTGNKNKNHDTVDWLSAGARLDQFKSRRNESEGGDRGAEVKSAASSEDSLLKLGETFFTQRQLEDTTRYFFSDENEFGNRSMKTFGHMGVSTKILAQATTDLFLHRYDTYKDMKLAAGPQVDQELCLSQLEYLAERTRVNLDHALDSEDMNFLRFIDTFGRAPYGLFVGNTFWVGSYDECKRLRINVSANEERIRAHYCIISFKFNSWPKDDPLGEVLVFKLGACLPESCDSTNYKNKYDLIVRIAEYNARQADLNTVEPVGVYCLPDEESEMRAWWRSTPTLLTAVFAGVWILVLAFATYKDELNRRRRKETEAGRLDAAGKIGLSTGFKASAPNDSNKLEKIYRSLSITSNLRSLFSTEKSSLLEVAHNASGRTPTPEQQQRKVATIVDLDVIEGVKVLAAMYIISGHVLMLSSQLVSNGRDFATSRSLVYTMSNLMPAFAVNAFFAITGILTSYLMFKQNQSHSFITSPLKWTAFILYRYLRIMPMYALVVLFCKHVARYTGDGPHWDYGTSSLAARRTCEQESWAWTLLFGANFKSPLKHCIPSAWYLANDFQFFIVTPIFLAALHKKPKLGKALLLVSVLVSYVAGIWSILASDAPDLMPIAQFMPHGFLVYVNFLHESYTRPYYRVPAYLIGLLLGHKLFEYELNRRAHLEQAEHDGEREAALTRATDAPTWSDRMRRHGLWFSALIVVFVILTPSIGSRLPLDPTSARILVALIMPTFHILYALCIGVYVLLSTTGYGSATMDWLLSRHLWKPLARLSLCVVLVNVEVITHIVQSSRDLKFMNNQLLASLNLYALFWTYIVATVVCILFEAPVRAALNHLLAYAVNQVAAKVKKTQ